MASKNEVQSLAIDEFPTEIVSKIFEFLTPMDLINCRLVNKSFYNVIGNFNKDQLGLVSLSRDWRISNLLTTIISDENSPFFTNFSLAVKYLSQKKINYFINRQGKYLKNLKISLNAIRNPEEIVEKLMTILDRAPHLRTLVLNYEEKLFRHENEDTEFLYLPQNLNLNPCLQLNSLKNLSFRGLRLCIKDLPGVESLLSKAPNLEKFGLVIENKVIPKDEFKSLARYLKKPLLSLKIFNVDETDESFFGSLLEHEFKLEEFGIITTEQLEEEEDFKRIDETFTPKLMQFLHANSGTLKSLKLTKDFMSNVNFSQLPALTSLTLRIYYETYETVESSDIKEVQFPPNLLKLEISSETGMIFEERDIILPSVRELITDGSQNHEIEDHEEEENPEFKYIEWAKIVPNVQIIRLISSSAQIEKYVVEHMSANLKELEIWSPLYRKITFWNSLVGENMRKIDQGELYDILEKKNSGEEVNFENIVPENFVPKASNLKKLQKLRLVLNKHLALAVTEEYVETLVFLSITKWLQPLDLLYINLPLTYKNNEIYPSSFLEFLQNYHKKVQISYETQWPNKYLF